MAYTKPDSGYTFEFLREEDGSLSPEAAIYQALGAASICWENPGGAGVFRSEWADAIGKALIAELGVQA